MAESTMDPSMWRERAQRAEAEVERLRDDVRTFHLQRDVAVNGRRGAEDRLRKVAELADRLRERSWLSADRDVALNAVQRELRAVLAAPPAEGSKIPSSRIGEADRSAPEAAGTTCSGDGDTCTTHGGGWVYDEDGVTVLPECESVHLYDVGLAPAPVSSGEAATGEAGCRCDARALCPIHQGDL